MAGPLANAVRAKFPGAYDDVPDAELEAAIKTKFPGAYDDVEDIDPVASHEQDFSKYGPMQSLLEDQATGGPARGQEAALLGSVGEVAGPVGAAVGGAVGSTINQLRSNEPFSMGQVGMDAAIQGGLSSAGPLLRKGAERVYSGLLKPAKAVRESFGNVAKTGLNERAMITQGGLSKITDRMKRSRGDAMGMVKAADEAGTQGVTGQQAVSEFPDVVKELRKRADIGQRSELPRVGERGKALLKTANRTVDIPLTRAQQLKETAQDASSGAYRQMEKGGSKQLSADDLLDTATAKGLRKGIESRVPGVGPQNQRTQELMGVTRALEDATGREAGNLGIGGMRDLIAAGVGGAAGGIPGAAGGAALMRLLATPSTGSAMAIGANELSKLPIAQLIRMAQMQALDQ